MRLFVIIILCLFPCALCGQTFDFNKYSKHIQSNFNQYSSAREKKFKEYRDSVNKEFAEYMRQAWTEYDVQPANPIPNIPEPPQPIIKGLDDTLSNDPVPFDKIIPIYNPVTPPQPVVPLPKPTTPLPDRPMSTKSFVFKFYGTSCSVSLNSSHRFSLRGVDENSVADAWSVLSSDDYLPIIAECLAWRDKLQLCDWGYVRFVQQLTTEFFEANAQNEARLMQMYILTQSGYKVRIARFDNSKLVLLLPSKDNIYEYSYILVDGEHYYVMDTSLHNGSFYVFNRKFPKEQYFSLQIRQEPLLAVDNTERGILSSRYYSELSVDVNRNLMDFYNDYPQSNNWDIYVGASLSKKTRLQLYPFLKQSIAGKTKLEAANILLNFVQTAFNYKTDTEQFGSERPLFADETLFYPYSDCEDRAIFYAVIIRELLDLDVVLLYYPGHLATAVFFGADTRGDNITVEGRKYIVCDPTYIGASIGNAMPQFKKTPAQVILLNNL